MARKFKSKESEYGYYARMINKGLDRIRSKFPESRLLERYQEEFDPNDYSPTKLREAKKLWNSGAVTVDSERRAYNAAVNTVREKYGLTKINRHNARAFFRFLDDARARGLGAMYTSEQLLTAFTEMRYKQKLTNKEIEANIEYWAQKNVQYDAEGKMVEPDAFKPLKILKKASATLKRYGEKLKARIFAERHGGK